MALVELGRGELDETHDQGEEQGQHQRHLDDHRPAIIGSATWVHPCTTTSAWPLTSTTLPVTRPTSGVRISICVVTVTITWSLPSAQAWWEMTWKGRPDRSLGEWWNGIDDLLQHRTREVAAPAGDLDRLCDV